MKEDPKVPALDDHYYKGNLTFDQFVLGVTLAASAYLAQTTKYGVLGWNESTLQLIPLLTLGLGAWLGFKRVESAIRLIGRHARFLEFRSRRPEADVSKFESDMEEKKRLTKSFYQWRNRVIFFGLASHVVVKVLISYPIF